MHEAMCLAAVIIFPLFAFFDYFTIPLHYYWLLTFLRMAISASIGVWLFVQRRISTDHTYLALYSFVAISWFCCLACVLGGKTFLYQHNVAYCTVFLGASLFLIWDWKNSFLVVLSSLVMYLIVAVFLADFDFIDFCMEGGTALLTIMVLHPLVIYFRFRALKRENALKEALKESYHKLLMSKEEVDHRNNDLLHAREKLNSANMQLREVNQHLEELVHARTVSLENTNNDLEEALAELDMFFYSSFHDLKGPVARVKGLSLLGLGDASEDTRKPYWDLMLKTASEMEDMLAKFNKMNMLHQIKPEATAIHLKDFLHTSIEKLPVVEHIALEVPSGLIINVDDSLLALIVENIIDNAYRYRDDVRPLEVIIKGVIVGNDLQLIFWDNGTGIKPAFLDKVFQMFFRASDKSTGHGLGLYLVKKAVEKLNGVVEIKSEESKYTQIRLVLPNVLV